MHHYCVYPFVVLRVLTMYTHVSSLVHSCVILVHSCVIPWALMCHPLCTHVSSLCTHVSSLVHSCIIWALMCHPLGTHVSSICTRVLSHVYSSVCYLVNLKKLFLLKHWAISLKWLAWHQVEGITPVQY